MYYVHMCVVCGLSDSGGCVDGNRPTYCDDLGVHYGGGRGMGVQWMGLA